MSSWLGAYMTSFISLNAIISTVMKNVIDFLMSHFFKTEAVETIALFDDGDILDLVTMPRGCDRFLNYYDTAELEEHVLNYVVKRGPNSGSTIKEVFIRKNLNDLIFDFDLSDYFVHKVQLYDKIKDPHHLIGQLFLRVNSHFNPLCSKKVVVPQFFTSEFENGYTFVSKHLKEELDMTIIEWLRLQDYRLPPSTDKLLPGQIHPGLGVGHEVEEMIMSFVVAKNRDGMLNTPEHWYNAYLYYTSSHFHFLNPAFEGFFRSINESVRKDIEKRRLCNVAWAIAQGKLMHRPTNTIVKWVSLEQVFPISKKLRAYFNAEYTNLVMKNYHPKDFYIEWGE
ncbi:hypothetical protein EIN_398270 [Entamoeba invadens IP1]|uniref:Uncharacterized protein n=2 Tax=Entamoeba invadens TaxID=33085 RepID=A0A0A1UA44_ENTIV|nr:hypothetical protein EIN_398270 [Entamoeba invadens IP1]ELP91897.1 hypothetical protein EIN_398270 [Entamoeba invadens IP1]BAN40351.1 hypothetical protein, conserved [Entamoeba invadens]|eukprot:XP_004258668.1 hypothetical protein EIN_398270 [Entamoeba invadens IP1]